MSSIRLLEHLDVEEPEARQTLCIMMRVRTEAQTFAMYLRKHTLECRESTRDIRMVL